ncbi:hypothetical protein [Streptomyces sp. SID3343]|uniref:hypothetical protein n=1 Tax=Streptomyces sp. SID3343 TaxID=2690260 RepID=UPI00136AD41A|nr:hypothetical protein [Streptomyces sp. SID3343]MYW04069.1 hypothetical protein [Streptomyces sp. SID3343]
MDEHIEGPDGPQDDGRTIRTVVDGTWIELPATIGGIRAALPAELRDEFGKVIEETPAGEMLATMVRWSRATRPDIEEADRRAHDRVKALTDEAEARIILGEDQNVVQRDLHERLRDDS